MIETWLKPNRRALILGMLPPIALGLGGGVLAWTQPASPLRQIAGCALLLAAAVTTLVLARKMFQPRLGYQDGQLLVFATGKAPIAVPIRVVECFFLGSDDATIPGGAEADSRVVAVVVRLAEAATDWKHREVKPHLAKWEDSYIMIRGTWCEPINADLVTALNRRLREVHRTCGCHGAVAE